MFLFNIVFSMEQFYLKMIQINLEGICNFILLNKYIYLFIFITYILLLFDKRFKYTYYKIIIGIFILIITLLLLLLDDTSLFIKDIFWYSKIINLSLIIHILWLVWIYNFFYYFRLEFCCWVISKIGFIFSLSFLMYLSCLFDLYYKLCILNLENYLEHPNWCYCNRYYIYHKHIILFIFRLLRTNIYYSHLYYILYDIRCI